MELIGSPKFVQQMGRKEGGGSVEYREAAGVHWVSGSMDRPREC